MSVSFQWFGDQAKAAVRAEVDRRMDAAGKAIVARARELVPIDTGKLQNSIGFSYVQATQVLTIHADMNYAAYVEFGHMTPSGGHVPAHPFLRPALAEAGASFGSTVSTARLQFGDPGR